MPTRIDDTRNLAEVGVCVDQVDELLARRLEPARQEADLEVLHGRLEDLERIGGRTFALVARAFGDWPATRRFVERFYRTGTPSVWPCHVIVRLDVFGVNGDDPETARKVHDQPRGTWLLATAGDELVDPTRQRMAVAGASRAERRREETP
jgi:hypothetical protein